MRFPAAALLLVVLSNAWVISGRHDRFFEELPKVFASHKEENPIGGTRDLLLSACGLRSLAADFAMIDMLIYYGTHDHDHGGHDHLANKYQADSGIYLDIYSFTQRVMVLDPFFRYAVLYGGGALAFNEGREEQAIEILEEGRRRDPKHWQYSLVISSIAYKKARNYLKIAETLEQVVDSPDCPTMLKNILANYYLKIQAYGKARLLFQKILDSATEEEYRQIAREKLAMLP